MMYFLSSEGISYKPRKFIYQLGSPIIIQDAGLGVLHIHLSQCEPALVGTCYAALEIQNNQNVNERR